MTEARWDDEPMTLDAIMAAMRDIESSDTIVCRLVAHPGTVDMLLGCMFSIGAEFHQSDWPPPLDGLEIRRDEHVIRTFIEGQNHKGDILRVWSLVNGVLTEWSDVARYRELLARTA